MRAMILAAGRGARMRTLTENRPKPLLVAGGRSLIEWQIQRLVEGGFTELVINTGWQAAAMVERVGSDNLFIHLDTYHMNIEEKGAANGILAAREHLRYIHLSESDRGVPGAGTCDWDEIHAALAAIGFQGGLAMESFIELPPQIAAALSVWRPVADSAEVVMKEGLPFLRHKACQYGLIARK